MQVFDAAELGRFAHAVGDSAQRRVVMETLVKFTGAPVAASSPTGPSRPSTAASSVRSLVTQLALVWSVGSVPQWRHRPEAESSHES